MPKPMNMNTNKKILLSVVVFLFALLIIFVITLRSSLNSIHAKAALKENFKTVSTGDFDKVNISSRCIVRIRHANYCKVELSAKDDSILKPKIENINGILYVIVDSLLVKGNSDSIHMRIGMPELHSIKAKGSNIHLESFDSDSLEVILGNGCIFSGNSNTLLKASYKVSGDAKLLFTQPF
jgi:hypothetical protein